MLPIYEYRPHDKYYFDGFSVCDISFLPHWHDFIEFVYVREGYIDINIGDTSLTVAEGTAVIISSKEIHSYESLGTSLVDFVFFSNEFFDTELWEKTTIHTLSETQKNEIEDILSRIKNKQAKEKCYNSYIYNAFNLSALLLLLSKTKTTVAEKCLKTLDMRNKELLKYLSENFRNDISLDMLSEKFNFSPSYFSHMFKNSFHCTYKDYLTSLKMWEARKLLTNTKLSVTDVCERIGYNNQRSFNRNFIKLVGMTPREYRNKYCSNINKTHLFNEHD